MDYNGWVTQLSNLTVIGSTDANFQIALPGARDYSEGRLYRELDLLAARVSNLAGTLSTNSRTIQISTTSGYIQIPEAINILTPAGATSSGTRNPVRFVTKQFIDNVYPSVVDGTGLPKYCAMLTDTTVLFGPSPDQAYAVEVIGVIQPTPLSSANPITWLTLNVPDLFNAASMVYMSAYMRDFGAQSDNPQQAQSWENQYMTLFKSADTNEARKQYRSQGWTSAQPETVSTPPRV